ncbi:dual specificity protein phosphatase 12-like [Hydractinia symbiolongicarpus]|uniref:dual specificity protein phosphatase 12-like n=1 Tax=Hydractinia symbiolongicarpus TaxID=13093 RepID=UPI00254BDACB|nr:dual specificity protein phosphatase 12-like [Hydractinia symbiolongicarpus]
MICFQIHPQLFVSDREAASCEQCLKEKCITHVLTVDIEECCFKLCAKHEKFVVENGASVMESDRQCFIKNTVEHEQFIAENVDTVEHEKHIVENVDTVEHEKHIMENVDKCNLMVESRRSGLVTAYTYALDVSNFNMLDVIAVCLSYMKQSLGEPENKLLVHCHAGQSRSVAIVTAYLMHTQSLPLDAALKSVQSVHREALPNPGFMAQLKLFEQMGFQINNTCPAYRQFITQQKNLDKLDSTFLIEHLIGCFQTSLDHTYQTLKCRLCRSDLFTSSDVQTGHDNCTSWHLLEPVHWMVERVQSEVQGKICCYKCCGKLGAYNWAGKQCSCGKWLTPSFQIHKCRVDAVLSNTKMPC